MLQNARPFGAIPSPHMSVLSKGNMTREFNQHQRYDSRQSYRGSSPNNRHGAEQPSRSMRPRLNRATVDRAWENGAPHRHADYKPRNPNEAGTTPTKHGPNSQRNWHKAQQSEHSPYGHTSHERDVSKRPPRYHDAHTQSHSSDHFSNGHRGSQPRSANVNNSFDNQPLPRNQRGNGDGANTYRAHNEHPNFRRAPQEGYQGRRNQEQYGAERHGDRFQGRQRNNFNEPRYPSSPATPRQQRENRGNQQTEQFEGDYEQFNRAPARFPRDSKLQEGRAPQIPSKRMGKSPERAQHVTPDRHVSKGSQPAQRKNAQFWTDISQDSEKLVQQVHAPQETVGNVANEQVQTSTSPAKQHTPATRVTSSRAKAAKHAASVSRKGKTERSVSNGPKPSQRGFKWPTAPSQS
jgi:hypothetical protein